MGNQDKVMCGNCKKIFELTIISKICTAEMANQGCYKGTFKKAKLTICPYCGSMLVVNTETTTDTPPSTD